MRKLVCLICLALLLAACGSEEPAPPPVKPAPSSKPTASTPPPVAQAVQKAQEVADQATKRVEAMSQQVAEKAQAMTSKAESMLTVVGSSGKAVYYSSCRSCHNSGVMGAPKIGDKEAWSEHMNDGLDHMVEKAIKGVGRMPAKGGKSSLTDAEVRAAVEYIIEQSR